MYEGVVISPTADEVEPVLEESELGVAKLAVEFLQQEYGDYLFFQHGAGEKTIGNLDQEIEPAFFPYFSAKTDGGTAQVCRIPAVRFDLVFEEPLHAGGVLGGTAVFERASNVGGDDGGRGFALGHFIPIVQRGRRSIAAPSWPRQRQPPTTRRTPAGASPHQSDA